MAIGKGSMARAAKVVKEAPQAEDLKKTASAENINTETDRKAVEKNPAAKKPAAKKPAEKKPVEKKPAAKKPAAKKTSQTKQAVVTPTKQVMNMVTKDRIEVGDEMPIYFY